jgi:Uma2 family endonuclease
MTTRYAKFNRPVAPSIPAKISYEEFLERYDAEHVEWVNGEVVAMAPVSDEHSDVGGFLIAVLRAFVEANKLGVIRYEPFQMKTGPDLPGRSPDVIFIAKKNLSRLKKNHLHGPADVVVEIISPGSRVIDRRDKHFEYERGGVREYWLLDPERRQAEFYVLGKDRIFRAAAIGKDDIFRSTVIKGFWLKLDWVCRRPLPPAVAVMKELGIF